MHKFLRSDWLNNGTILDQYLKTNMICKTSFNLLNTWKRIIGQLTMLRMKIILILAKNI